MSEPSSNPCQLLAEDWGRIAVSLPGWRWMPGMQPVYLGNPSTLRVHDPSQWRTPNTWPDPDDPATAGCLLALLGSGWAVYRRDHDQRWEVSRPDGAHMQDQPTIGRACIAAAAALERWPGGDL